MTDSEPGGGSDTGVSVWVLVAVGVSAVALLGVVVFFLFDSVFETDPSTTVPEAVDTTVTPTITTTTTTTLSATSFTTQGSTTTAGTELAEVTIEEDFEVGGGGSFLAMSDGLICDEGSVLDRFVRDDTQAGGNTVLEAETVFTCADGTGTFTLTLFVILYPDFTSTFDWLVKEGTGSYEGLSGQGTGTGIPVDFPLKHNSYVGQMILG